ncbi:SET domain-containing protein [Ceraceosorus guamensis]|uniref:SET domain-containing protein n=1 Tax=Ceraceosorus guamensis TaxID=1522189 RepID=A0A316VWP7_9BASI|nr:SET domain-containing protein [Ceraceosorus guamensis]PWN41869.1 SET domain-containing protein [Ceraceosorus guamensis]
MASNTQHEPTPVEQSFLNWFESTGGYLSPDVSLHDFTLQGMGRGMKSNKRLERDALLFSIPRYMLLGTRTSTLPSRAIAADEKAASLEAQTNPHLFTWQSLSGGWTQLLLVMLWEHFRSTAEGGAALNDSLAPRGSMDDEQDNAGGSVGPSWGPYFDILPRNFDTPMFWDRQELQDLEGTTVREKIGLAEAQLAYRTQLLPYIHAHPDLFVGSKASANARQVESLISTYYSEELFHRMGSAVLSRSFHVNLPGQGGLEEVGEAEDGMEVEDDEDEDEEDGEGEGEENINDVCMVPMADMLNARFESDNARTFYHQDVLEMRTTQVVEAGEQLLNTYGDPPNCDLIRRYGYVDEPNGADVAELPATTLVDALLSLEGLTSTTAVHETRRADLLSRLGWTISIGFDEVHALAYLFPLSQEAPFEPTPLSPTERELRSAAASISDELLAQARVLIMSPETLEKLKKKDKLPSSRIEAREFVDGQSRGVAEIIARAIELRLEVYPTTLQDNRATLYASLSTHKRLAPLSARRRNALVVRSGEQSVLMDNLRVLKAADEASRKLEKGQGVTSEKRKDASESAGHKKSKR